MALVANAGAWRSLIFSFCLTIGTQAVDAFHMTVENYECVSEYVAREGDLVSGNFVVVDKRFDLNFDGDDIEMVVTGPSGKRIMTTKAREGQKFRFNAPKQGHYKICFFNPTRAPEKVDFAIHVGHISNAKDLAKDEHFNPLETIIVQFREVLEQVSLEQQYYRARDARHRLTNESTHSRLMWYTLIVYVALTTCSIAQVYLVQRLFSRSIGYNRI